MSYILGAPLRARLLDAKDGVKVFGYACGHVLADTNANKERMFVDPYPQAFPILPVAWQARLIDVDPGGFKVFGIVSECHLCPPDLLSQLDFVLKGDWPPYGVPTVMKFEFISLSGYPQAISCLKGHDGCPSTTLVYAGGFDWVGSFAADGGTWTMTLTLLAGTQDPDRPLAAGWPPRNEWTLTISGCQGPTTVQAHANWFWPVWLGGQGFGIGTGCCPSGTSLPTDVGFSIYGYTAPYMPARLVDSEGGLKLFYTNECCPVPANCKIGCCGVETVPFQYTFTVAGVTDPGTPPPPPHNCVPINATYTLTYTSITAPSECHWTSTTVSCGGWTLRCLSSDGLYHLDWDGSLGCGDAAHYTLAIASWDPNGPNVMTFSSSSGVCGNWPATLTVTPV